MFVNVVLFFKSVFLDGYQSIYTYFDNHLKIPRPLPMESKIKLKT